MTLDPAQVLEDAADVLLVNGRCRIVGHNTDGSFCVLGAIAEAVQPGWWQEGDAPRVYGVVNQSGAREAVSAVARRVPLLAGRFGIPPLDDQQRVYEWNDHLAADDDEVRDTLLLAAKDLRAAAVPS